jgi:molecular chaperone DnaK
VIVWEGKGGTFDARNQYMGILIITGDNLSSLLPKGSDVEITITLDKSRRANVSAYLPYLDETVENVFDTKYKRPTMPAEEISKRIKVEKERLSDIEERSIGAVNMDDDISSIGNGLDELDKLHEQGRGDNARSREIENRINELAIKLDEIDKSVEWPQTENELNDELKYIEELLEICNDEKSERALLQIKPEVAKAIKIKDIKRAKDALGRLSILKWHILFEQPHFWVDQLHRINEEFDEIKWSDRSKARGLVEKGCSIVASGQFTDEIKDIVSRLWDLMPEAEREKRKQPPPRDDILHY